MDIGYTLICEEHPPTDLVDNAVRAEEAGFTYAAISDHFHPWLPEQGNAPFAWTVLGALTARTDLPLMTQVTCPTKRYHPAIVAQMAATTAAMAPKGFTLGLGTGELLNEHVVGGEWPDPDTRQDMFDEALGIIRDLFTGEETTHRGRFYTVDRAQLYTLPDEAPPIAIAAGGTTAAQLAARAGAALISTSPSSDLVEAYHEAGGTGPVYGQATVCWHEDADEAAELMRDHWRQSALDWDANAELVNPAAFSSATQTVRVEDVTGSKPMGHDLDEYLQSLSVYRDAGFDNLSLHNVGPHQEEFIDWCRDTLFPALEE